jgi:hypothetical protein
MTVERYPNPNGGFGGSIPGYEIFSLLDGKTKSPPTARKTINPTMHQEDLYARKGQRAQIHVKLPDIVYYYNFTLY